MLHPHLAAKLVDEHQRALLREAEIERLAAQARAGQPSAAARLAQRLSALAVAARQRISARRAKPAPAESLVPGAHA
ncbi:MAG: hypothetical protein OJF49_002418 [Ktedonobacterales bacterium]|jgi:hypothetical protein|nr:MAG: hypothetical protein OJF49_002418 [Ktedonobacterales bacterium]